MKIKSVVLVSSFILALTANSAFAGTVVLDSVTKAQIEVFSKLKDQDSIQTGFCNKFVLGHKLVGEGQLNPFLKEMNSRLRSLNKKPIRCNLNLKNLPEAKGQDRFLKTKEVSYRSSKGFSKSQLNEMKTVKVMSVPPGTIISGPTLGGGASGVAGAVATGGGILGGGSVLASSALIVGGAVLGKAIYDEVSSKSGDDAPISGGNSSL